MMKKFLFIVVLFLSIGLEAQTPDKTQIVISLSRLPNSTSIGITSGLNISQTLMKNFQAADPESPIASFSSGIVIRQQILERWSVNANVLYEQKGYQRPFYFTNAKGEPIGDPHSVEVRFNYLTLPLYMSLHTSGNIQLNIGAGVYTGVLLNSFSYEPWFNSNWMLPSSEWEFIGVLKRNQTEHSKRLDFGITAQAGMNIRLTECISTGLNIHFDHGLISKNKPDTFYGIKHLNRSMGIRMNMNYNF